MLLTIILLILLGIDWASGYAIAGYVMRNGVTPIGYAFWQCFGPFFCILLIQIFRKDIKYYKGSIKYAIGCGVFGVAIPNLLVYYASEKVDSGILTVLANTDPIITYILALLLSIEKFNKNRMLMVITATVGVIILVWPNNIYNITHNNAWLYLSLLIPLCYAFGIVFISKFKPTQGDVLNYSMWMLLFACLVILPVTITNGGYYPLNLAINSGLIILEILLSTIGYVLLFVIINRAGPVLFVMVNGISAITGLLYGKLIFNQQISFLSLFASILIVLSIIGMSVLHNQKLTNKPYNNK